jgi:hypothetical protein
MKFSPSLLIGAAAVFFGDVSGRSIKDAIEEQKKQSPTTAASSASDPETVCIGNPSRRFYASPR